MIYDGSNQSAINVLELIGIENISQFAKTSSNILTFLIKTNDKTTSYFVYPGDNVFTSANGEPRIVETSEPEVFK